MAESRFLGGFMLFADGPGGINKVVGFRGVGRHSCSGHFECWRVWTALKYRNLLVFGIFWCCGISYGLWKIVSFGIVNRGKGRFGCRNDFQVVWSGRGGVGHGFDIFAVLCDWCDHIFAMNIGKSDGYVEKVVPCVAKVDIYAFANIFSLVGIIRLIRFVLVVIAARSQCQRHHQCYGQCQKHWHEIESFFHFAKGLKMY